MKLFVKESILYSTGQVLTRLASFILVPFFTYVFSPNEVGHIYLFYSTLTFMNIFNNHGLDSALFKYSTTTTDADPGSGIVRFNHATFSSVTELYIDDEDFNGTDVSSWVQSFDDVSGNDTNRGRIRIQNAGTLTTYITFKVTGAVTDATGYTKVTVSHIASSGTLSNNDKVFISFVASGEDGAIPGYFYKFDTGTSDTDPGAGEIASVSYTHLTLPTKA